MPRWGSVQHVLILGLAVVLMGMLAGCGSAGEAQDDGQQPAQNPPTAETPAENPLPPENDARGAPQAEPADPEPLENEAFRVRQPEANAVVGMTLKLEGESRTFEGNFHYTLEDGHNILAEGVVQTSAGAPEWASFSADIQLQEAPTSPHGVLILYEPSAKDGQPTHELVIPLTFDEAIVNLE